MGIGLSYNRLAGPRLRDFACGFVFVGPGGRDFFILWQISPEQGLEKVGVVRVLGRNDYVFPERRPVLQIEAE